MRKSGENGVETALRVMVVDDDPFVREVAVTALAAAPGVTVGAFDSGAAALAAFDDFAPGLVLLDLMMPGMDGRAVAAALAARRHTARLIFLTGRDDAATRAEVAALGADGLIAKPFDPGALAAAVLGLADPANTRAARLEALARNFASGLPAARETVERAWGKLAVWNAAAAEAVLAEAHRIAGVAPMFGFADIGAAADKVEELFRVAVANSGWRAEAERGAMQGAVAGLVRAIGAVK